MKFTLKQARNYAELSQAEMAKSYMLGLIHTEITKR